MGLESQWGQRNPGPRVPTATDQGPTGDHRETAHLKVSHKLHVDLVSAPCSSLAVKRKEFYIEEHLYVKQLTYVEQLQNEPLLLFLNYHPSLGITVKKWPFFLIAWASEWEQFALIFHVFWWPNPKRASWKWWLREDESDGCIRLQVGSSDLAQGRAKLGWTKI